MVEGAPHTPTPREDAFAKAAKAYSSKVYEPVEKWVLEAAGQFFDLPKTVVEKAPEKIIHGSLNVLAPIVMLLAGSKDLLKKGSQYVLNYLGGKELVDAHKSGKDAIRWALGYGALREKK
ncbi:MAG: hypothetical protein HY472_00610 [Candidatus Sungbacteria bacterium]|nr:hypothetical protein [Candidatus Sungbacteria bacterium]